MLLCEPASVPALQLATSREQNQTVWQHMLEALATSADTVTP